MEFDTNETVGGIKIRNLTYEKDRGYRPWAGEVYRDLKWVWHHWLSSGRASVPDGSPLDLKPLNTPAAPRTYEVEIACAEKHGVKYLARRHSGSNEVVIYHWRGVESEWAAQPKQEQDGYAFGPWQTITLPLNAKE